MREFQTIAKRLRVLFIGLLSGFLSFAMVSEQVWGQDELAQQKTWSIPTSMEGQTRIQRWLDAIDANDAVRAEIRSYLETHPLDEPRTDRLKIVLDIIEIANPTFAPIRQSALKPRTELQFPDFSTVLNEQQLPFVRDHARLLLSRWMTQNELYDESIKEMGKIDPKQLLAPDAFYFYRALAEHQLLEKEKCLASIETLLQHESQIPRRYSVLAKLIAADMAPLKEDSLDEIARLMNDIRRRQSLYRSGKTVRQQEEEVIKKLDKQIEELEAARKKMMQQPGGQSNPSSPMQDSQQAQGLGSGEVTNKKTVDGGQWGNLPPAERAAALAEMAKDLPPHYRAVIEEYFKKLADDQRP